MDIILVIISFMITAFANNSVKLLVNVQEIKSDVPPQIISGRTMAPIRWVAKSLGAEVEWTEDGQCLLMAYLLIKKPLLAPIPYFPD